MANLTCLVDDCDQPPHGREWCRPHYLRWYRHGDPLFGRYTVGATPTERVRQGSVVTDDGCWIWRYGTDKDGYGKLKVGWVDWRAHRYSWTIFRGPIPDGLVPDHLCRNPPCVNPDHLEIVTVAENNARGFGIAAVNGRKTHCWRGHEFTPENTLAVPGGRDCRKCRKIRRAIQNERKRVSGLGTA